MPRYIVETTYHLPIYRQRHYEAATVEEACRLAVADESWDDEEQDVDSSGQVHVTGIWEGAACAYDGEERPIPPEFDEIAQRKADLFERVVALLQEPARPMGLSCPEFEAWLPRAVAVLARADAIREDR